MTSPSRPAGRYDPGALLDIPFGEWKTLLGLAPSEVYRARQLQEWVFKRRARTYDEMTSLPSGLRQKLQGECPLRVLSLAGREASRDGTVKFIFRTGDGLLFPAVFLPSKNEEGERHSLCLSTQVGCAWGCAFCRSGRVRLERNLHASEIMEPLLWVEEETKQKVTSLLFMGMGEPLANYNNVLWALQCLRSPLGFGFGARHVTLSTCGLMPQMLKMAGEAPKVNLAVSLHAADDETRRRLMPKAAQWPLKEVLKAAWVFQRRMEGARVTFEYLLLKGINDSLRTAQRLSNLIRDHKAWVNLIVFNPVPGLPYERPPEETVARFARVLSDRGIFVRVRKPQGTDISAGCGQLGKPHPIQ